jgi:hypothetical protein
MSDPNAVTPAIGNAQPAISPTGQALLPAKYVPYALALSALPGAVAGVLAAAHVFPQAVQWLGIASGLLLAVLGVVSPGLRRGASAAVLFVCVGLSLQGCATLKNWWTDTVDCALQDQGKLLASMPAVITAAATQNWVGALDGLAGDLGDIVLCDAAAIAAPPAQAASAVAFVPAVASSNAAQYLALKGKTVKNATSAWR